MAETGRTPSRILVLGGARSGKSAFAQAQADAVNRPCIFIATAEPFDDEMRERILRHVQARPPAWHTIEAPFDLCGTLRREAAPNRIVLVDCLTVWLGNLMFRGKDLDAASAELVEAIRKLEGDVIFVSNEVGMGIVPEHPEGREFRDAQGRLNQMIAGVCDMVVAVTAGLPQLLKPAAQLNLGLA